MKTIALLAIIICTANGELVTLTNGKDVYAVDRDSIISIEPAETGNQFFSRAQNKTITLDPYYYKREIQAGLSNGNLRRITQQTIIKLGKQYQNTQVAVAGSAVLGAGDAKISGASNQIIVNIPVADVIKQLGLKSP